MQRGKLGPDVVLVAETGFHSPGQRPLLVDKVAGELHAVFHDPEWDGGGMPTKEPPSRTRMPPSRAMNNSQGVGFIARNTLVHSLCTIPSDVPGILWNLLQWEESGADLIVAVAYIPSGQSRRDAATTQAHLRRGDIFTSLVHQGNAIRKEHPWSSAVLMGDFNATPAEMDDWLRRDFDGESNPWVLLDNSAPTFERPAASQASQVDYVLVAQPLLKGDKDASCIGLAQGVVVSPPPPGLGTEAMQQFHNCLSVEILVHSKNRRGIRGRQSQQRKPATDADKNDHSSDEEDDQDQDDEVEHDHSRQKTRNQELSRPRQPDPATPSLSKRDTGCWDQFAREAKKSLDYLRHQLQSLLQASQDDVPSQSPSLDYLVASFTDEMRDAAHRVFGVHPADISWVKKHHLIPRGPRPSSVRPEWITLAQQRLHLTHMLKVDRSLTHQMRRWIRTKRTKVARRMRAMWRTALQADAEQFAQELAAQDPGQRWKRINQLSVLDDALTGSTSWKVARATTATTKKNALNDPSLASPDGDPRDAAMRFCRIWQPKFSADSDTAPTRAMPLTQRDKALLGQFETEVDIVPSREWDWDMLRTYVRQVVPRQRTDAAIGADGFHFAWRKAFWTPPHPDQQDVEPNEREPEDNVGNHTRATQTRENQEAFRQHPEQLHWTQVFRYTADVMDDIVTAILMISFMVGRLPTRWNARFISPVRKPGKPRPEPGQPDDPNHFRPVAAGSRLASWALGALNRWLTDRVEESHLISDVQVGFRSGVGGASVLPMVIQTIAAFRVVSLQRPTFVCSLDLAGAYDSVDHRGLDRILEWNGISHRVRAVLMDSMQSKMTVRVRGRHSDPFVQTRGVPQGNPLSPLLFSLFLERVIRGASREIDTAAISPAEWSERAQWIEGPSILAYADDIILLAHSSQELQRRLHIVADHIHRAGLHLNAAKTHICVFGKQVARRKEAEGDIFLMGERITPQTSIKVLGVPLHSGFRTAIVNQWIRSSIRRATGWTRRTVVDGRTPPFLAGVILQARGVGRIAHLLPVVMPSTAARGKDSPTETALRQAARAVLRLPSQASSNWTMWEAQWLSLWERAFRARDLIRVAANTSEKAVLARYLVELQEAAREEGHMQRPLPQENPRLHVYAREVLSAIPEARKMRDTITVEEHKRVGRAVFLKRRWEEWIHERDPRTEITPSPLRLLHNPPRERLGMGDADEPELPSPTMPKWVKSMPGGEGARLLAHLRAGRCLYLRHTEAQAAQLWKQNTILAMNPFCAHCLVTDDALHLATCAAPERQEPREQFLANWVYRAGITHPTPLEVLAVLVGEAPHHCGKLNMMPDDRKQLWKNLFHFTPGDRSHFYTQLSACLVRMLTTRNPPHLSTDTAVQSEQGQLTDRSARTLVQTQLCFGAGDHPAHVAEQDDAPQSSMHAAFRVEDAAGGEQVLSPIDISSDESSDQRDIDDASWGEEESSDASDVLE